MKEPFLKLVRYKSGKTFLAYARKLPWKDNDLAWFRPMKFLWWKWEKVYNKKDIEVIPEEEVWYQNSLKQDKLISASEVEFFRELRR